MLSLVLSQQKTLIMRSYQTNHSKINNAMFILMMGIFSFSAMGCSALNALEPTAVLISDIKNSI